MENGTEWVSLGQLGKLLSQLETSEPNQFTCNRVLSKGHGGIDFKGGLRS